MKGIRFEVVWWDDDLIELEVTADNGRFAAQTRSYVRPDFAAELARVIEGFPRRADDERTHTLGTLGDDYAGGGVRMYFHCLDGLGHGGVLVTLRSDPREPVEDRGTATFLIPVEAAAVDDFVRQLRTFNVDEGSRQASLRG